MSLDPGLSVRVYNDDVDTSITQLLSNVSYRSVVPGGYASAELTFKRPLDLRRPEVAAYTHVVITDDDSGETAWQGQLEDPGPAVQSDGDVFQITAMGPSARAGDTTAPRNYIDTDASAFGPKIAPVASATQEVAPAAGNEDALVITAPGGTVLGSGIVGAMYYDRLVQSRQQLGGIGYSRLAGKTDANYQNELLLMAADGTPANETPVSQNWSTVAASLVKVVGTDWTAGLDTVRLTVRRSGGATTVADDVTWGAFYDVYVAARRLLASGAFAPNADHNRAYVLASEVFADLVGSGLLPFDGATAAITDSTYHIDQFAYPDGANAQQILDDALAFDPACYWAAWEGDPPRCEFSLWPTTPAIVASVDDGYEAPQSSADLFNQVMLRWVDGRGRVQTLYADDVTTGISGVLTAAGVNRRAFFDLNTEIGSDANADRYATNFLTDHAYPPNGGTVTLRHPVLDLSTGRLIQPRRVRPGVLAVVNGVDPYPDTLNAIGRDGSAVARVIATEYDAASNSVVCELDSYSRALERSLRRANRRRRGN